MYKTFKDYVEYKETPPPLYEEGFVDAIRSVGPGLTGVAKTAAVDATKAIASSGSYFSQAYSKANAARRIQDMKKYIDKIVQNYEFKSLKPDVQKVILSVQKYFAKNHK